MLHLAAPTRRSICSPALPSNCSEFRTSGDCSGEGQAYTAYVLVDKGSLRALGFAAFGITYGDGRPGASNDGRGLDIVDWRSCGFQQIPSSDSTVAPGVHSDVCGRFVQPVPHVASGFNAWPEPGSFVELSWQADDAGIGGLVVAYAFQLLVYSPDTLQVTVIPTTHDVGPEKPVESASQGQDGREFPRGAWITQGGVCRISEVAASVSGSRRFLDIDPANLGRIVFSPGAVIAGYNPCQAN